MSLIKIFGKKLVLLVFSLLVVFSWSAVSAQNGSLPSGTPDNHVGEYNYSNLRENLSFSQEHMVSIYSNEASRKRKLDLVFLLDTSWSMDDEWDDLSRIIENITSYLREDSVIDLKYRVYGMSDDWGPSDPIADGHWVHGYYNDNYLYLGDYFGRESWGPASAGVARYYDWRDESSRIVCVIADEGPYGGGTDKESIMSYEDNKSIRDAVEQCNESFVTNFLMYGDRNGIEWTKKQMKKLAEGTDGGTAYWRDAETARKAIQKFVYERAKVPWIQISLNKKNFSPGEEVEVMVDVSNPDDSDLALKVMNGSSRVYYHNFGEVQDNIHVTIPALPVYPEVQGNDYTIKAGFIGGIKENMGVEISEPTKSEIETLMLTNLSRLEDSINEENWGDTDPTRDYNKNSALFLIDNEMENENGLLINVPRDKRPTGIQTTLQNANNDYDPKTLIILGDEEIIPYSKGRSDDGETTTSDSIYWDLNGDLYPDWGYGRIPLQEKVKYTSEEYMENLNYMVLKNSLETSEIRLDNVLLLAGRDFSHLMDEKLMKEKNNIANNFTNRNLTQYFAELSRVMTNVWISDIHGSYNQKTLEDANVIWGTGHGSSFSIASVKKPKDKPISPDLVKQYFPTWQRFLNTDNLSVMENMHNSSSDDIITLNFPGRGKHITPDGDFPLSNDPLLLYDACSTANYYSFGDGSIADVALYLGASGSRGWGADVHLSIIPLKSSPEMAMTNDYSELLSKGGMKLGKIFADSITEGMDALLVSFKDEYRYAIQYGNPNLNIKDTTVSTSSTVHNSTLSLPNNLSFLVENYSVAENAFGKNKNVISFYGSLDGKTVESENWTRPGNPIVPFVFKKIELGENKTVTVTWSSDTVSVGKHDLAWTPAIEWGGELENRPLEYDKYMPAPVRTRISGRRDNTMAMGIRIFPFQYDVNSHNIVMHDNIQIDIKYSDRTTSISSITMENKLVKKGENINLQVGLTSPGKVVLNWNNDNVQGSGSSSYNFSIPSENFNVGVNYLDVNVYGSGLNDMSKTTAYVIENKLDISIVEYSENTQIGENVSVEVSVRNEGSHMVEPEINLEMEQDNVTENVVIVCPKIDPGESKTVSGEIDTIKFSPGEVELYSSSTLGIKTFQSEAKYLELTSTPPIAEAGGPYIWAGSPITLDATNSYDPDGTIENYRWDLDNDGWFDDATGSKPTVKIENSYSNTIYLKVIDDDGSTDIDSGTLKFKMTPVQYYRSRGPTGKLSKMNVVRAIKDYFSDKKIPVIGRQLKKRDVVNVIKAYFRT